MIQVIPAFGEKTKKAPPLPPNSIILLLHFTEALYEAVLEME